MSGASDFDTADVVSVETAVNGLLDKVQSNLGFPYSTDTTPPPPSTALNYRFNASIEVYLTTQWPLFAGLTLTNISLKATVDKYKNAPSMMTTLTFPIVADYAPSGLVCRALGVCHDWGFRFHGNRQNPALKQYRSNHLCLNARGARSVELCRSHSSRVGPDEQWVSIRIR